MTLKNFLATLIATFVIFTHSVEAKIVTEKLPLLTYAETTISVYDAPNGTQKGTIPIGKSLVLVKQIRPDGWAYGSYKIPNKKKRVYCWFNMNELQGYADFENYTEQTTYDTDAYRTRTSASLVGKVSSHEDILVVAKRGDKIKVIFKADGDYYRMGWIDTSSLQSNSTNSSNDLLGSLMSNSNSNSTIPTGINNSSNEIENFPDDNEDFSGDEEFADSENFSDEDRIYYEGAE